MDNQLVNIFVNADVHNCTDCIHDSRLGYSISWEENNNLNGYDSVGGLTSYTTWDGVYFATSISGSCFISPSDNISVDASYYTLVRAEFRIDVDYHTTIPTVGQIQFQTSNDTVWDASKTVEFAVNPDNAYHEYLIDMASHLKWNGTVTSLRLYPFIDGTQGIKMHLRSIKIESRKNYACDSGLVGAVCDKSYLFEHPCPWTGSPGRVVSSVVGDNVTIQEGVNDKILVNIDGYGNQLISLRPVYGSHIKNVARDIQDKLNLIGVGGYAFARCYVDNNSFVIDSDWFNSDSTVVVTEPEEFSAGFILGLFDLQGNKIAVETSGVTSASRYERAPLQLSSSAIGILKGSNRSFDKTAFSVDGSVYSPQGGYSGYRNIVKDTKIEFKDKTLIDYDNPISGNGIITFIGYSGDAYTNTEFRVYRQRLDGSMLLIVSIDMSEEEDSEDKIFEKEVSISVKKGDLLGLFSAALHTGSELEKTNYTYILASTDLQGGGGNWELNGAGEKGLPVFARGQRRNNEVRLQVDFDEIQSLETITMLAEEDSVQEEINLCTVRNGGLGGGPFVSGQTGVGLDSAPALSIENLSSLIDGDKQNINGTSTYCYPGWLDLSLAAQLDYAYTDFQISFDFAKGVDVHFPIYKIKMYFVDEKNIQSFRWEIPTATNPSDTSRLWGIGWDSYTKVFTDLGLMDSNSIYLYNNPAVLISGDYLVSYAHLNYRYLEFQFDPFYARSMRYNATIEGTNITDTYKDDYAYYPFTPSPKIQEIEIYSRSIPEKNITSSLYFESSNDAETYLTHYDFNDVSSTEAVYVVGRPVTSLKLHLKSNNLLKVYNIYGVLSEDYLDVHTSYRGVVALTPSRKEPELAVEEVIVTNDSEDTSNFYIDIFDENSKTERCLFWNKLSTDTNILMSEIGPGGIMAKRQFKKLRPHNYAYNCPGYFLDKSFSFGKVSYISRDDRNTWISVGSIITDSSEESYLTNESSLFHKYPYIYVALDLGSRYNINSVVMNSIGGEEGWSGTILYSSMDTAVPSDIPIDLSNPNSWSVSSKSNARWVQFEVQAVDVGAAIIKYLSYVTINTLVNSSINYGKLLWKSANGKLTNGVSGTTSLEGEEGWIFDGQSDYFCVNLCWWHNVTNVITGPMYSTAGDIDDTDVLLPGTWPSIVDASCVGENVAYSASSTDDPSEVVWGDFGATPPSLVRWVMVRAIDSSVEEIIVHVANNVANNKVSFLNSLWFESSINPVYNEFVNTKSGLCAAALDYPANSSQVEEYILLKQSLGIDRELAKRDTLSFWFYVSDASELDFSYGYFRLGRSTTQENSPLDINLTPDDYNYYEWDLSLLEEFIEDGWNYLSLPFSDNYRSGVLYFASDNRTRIADYSKRDRITNFKFAFRGIESNNMFTVRIDDFTINRRYYSDCNFDYGVYLPHNEYIKFPLNDFDPTKGTIEFYLKSDWTRSYLCNSCEDPRDHAILRVYSAEDDSVFGLYMTGDGLKFYVTDGISPAMVVDNNKYNIYVDVPTHVALVWNFLGDYDAPSMGIYINNQLASSLNYGSIAGTVSKPSFIQRGLYTMMLGGIGWPGITSYHSSSVDGAVENLKVFNYPITDFSYHMNNNNLEQLKRASELIELSLDGVNFYGIEYSGSSLPLLKKDVSSGSCFPVYVRCRDIVETKEGQRNRKSYISVARTPSS